MQTLKQFLQNLSYKRDKTIARSAKSLVLAIKKSTVPEKLDFYVSEKNFLCDNCQKLLFKATNEPQNL